MWVNSWSAQTDFLWTAFSKWLGFTFLPSGSRGYTLVYAHHHLTELQLRQLQPHKAKIGCSLRFFDCYITFPPQIIYRSVDKAILWCLEVWDHHRKWSLLQKGACICILPGGMLRYRKVKQVTQQVTGIRIHVSWFSAQNLIWSKIWLDNILLSLEFYRL